MKNLAQKSFHEAYKNSKARYENFKKYVLKEIKNAVKDGQFRVFVTRPYNLDESYTDNLIKLWIESKGFKVKIVTNEQYPTMLPRFEISWATGFKED